MAGDQFPTIGEIRKVGLRKCLEGFHDYDLFVIMLAKLDIAETAKFFNLPLDFVSDCKQVLLEGHV